MKSFLNITFATLLMLVASQAAAAGYQYQACENFAAKFAVDAVTSDLLMNGQAIFTYDIAADLPVLQKSERNEDGYILTYTAGVSLTQAVQSGGDIRYEVTLQLEDHDASCFLVDEAVVKKELKN